MKIESIIRRAAGSTVVLGDQTYRFLPGEDDRHVCEVEDEAHIERLLSIKEGFREVTAKADDVSAPRVPVVAAAVEKKAEGGAKPKGGRKAKVAEAPAANTAADASSVEKKAEGGA